MVSTIKFSQMTAGGDLANNDQTPGLLGGDNVLFNNPWTFLPPGTTAERPAPSSAINYRLRFNTDDQLYEYYDAVLMQWTQLQESFFTAGPFVTYTASLSLPDAFNLGSLGNGILKQTVSTGISTPAIALVDTDYYGPGMVGFMQQPAGIKDINALNILTFATIGNTATDWLVLRNGMFMQPPTVTVDGAATDIQLNLTAKGAGEIAFNTLASSNAISFFTGTAYQHQTLFSFANTSNNVTATWQDTSGTVAWLSDVMGTVLSLQGTASQVLVNGTSGTPETGILTLTTPQDIDTTSDVTFNSLTLTTPLASDYGGTGVNNAGNLLGYEGNISFIGAYTLQITLSAATSIQFPTSGILLNSNLTSADFYVGNGSNIATGVAMSGDASLANTGAVTVSKIGGVGISLAGAFTTHGAFTADFTFTGNTSVTFPTSGTLATTASASGTVNTGTAGQLAYYATSTNAVSGTNAGTGVLTALGTNVGSAGAFVVNGGALGTPSSGTLSSCTGLPISSGVSGLGTGIATALGVNVGSAGAPVLFNGAGGTPSSLTLTNATGLPIAGITGLGTGVGTALALSLNGSGAISATTSPTFVTPVLGAASATSINFGGSTLSTYAASTSYTPTITYDTPGDLSVAYGVQVGVYSRIGNIVSAHFVLSCTPTFTTASGNLRIVLPVTPSFNATGSIQFQASTWPAGTTSIFLQIVNGNTGMVVGVNGSAVATTYITTTQTTSGVALNIIGSVTYLV